MYDIITIGTATQDVFLGVKGMKHLKDPEHLKKIGFPRGEAECFALGAKLEIEELHETFGGGAANSAITFSRQGLKTHSVIRVGNDRIGRNVIGNLENENVSLHAVKDAKRKTAYSTVLLLSEGERTVLVYRGASADFTKKEVGISKLNSGWAYINPGTIPFAVVAWMIKSFRRRGIKVAINPSKTYLEKSLKQIRPLLKRTDILILNRDEAAKLARIDFKKDRQILRKLIKLTDGIVVMTDGPQGSFVTDGRFIYKAGIYKEKKIVDRTGAGDAFGSGFVAGLIKENDINYALRLGSANATSVVEHMGAQEGILKDKDINQKRFQYLDLDVEPLI